MVTRPTWTQLVAAVWAYREWRSARRALATTTLDRVELRPAPPHGLTATRGARLALRLCRATCLERSLVMQRWYGDQGVPVDLVIGVSSPREKFGAHAWLERPGELTQFSHTVLLRRAYGDSPSQAHPMAG